MPVCCIGDWTFGSKQSVSREFELSINLATSSIPGNCNWGITDIPANRATHGLVLKYLTTHLLQKTKAKDGQQSYFYAELGLIILVLVGNVSERNVSRHLHISCNTVKFFWEQLLTSPYSFNTQTPLLFNNEVRRNEDFHQRLPYFLHELKGRGMTRQLR